MSSKNTNKISADAYIPVTLLTDIRKRHSEECTSELAGLQLSNFLYNVRMSRYYPGILGFEGALKKIPAIIIGVGPSLTPNVIKLLKENRRNVILVSVDASLPLLAKQELYPHFCVMVDPTEKQRNNFEGIDTKKFYTIVPPIVHPSIFRIVDPKHLAIYNVKDPKSELMEQAPYHTGKKGALPAGVLTSGSAFAFAAICGCDPIIFVGHDLCWHTPDKVYAEGISGDKRNFQMSVKFRGGCLLFPDIHGKLVLTHETFVVFWAWMRDMVGCMQQRVINCTGEGILAMKGIRQMKLDRVMKVYGNKELVGLEEKITKAYNYEIADGYVERLLVPKFKKTIEVVK